MKPDTMLFFNRLQRETTQAREQLMRVPIIQDALQGRILLAQYVAFLTQAYHHVKHTVPLLMACGSSLPARLDWLRSALADYIADEIGHDEWILADITACGGDPDATRRSPPNLATDVMVAYAYHQIDRKNPVGFFGMVHVLEGTSTAIATDAAVSIRDALKLPPSAFTYLASHGSLDLKHVQFFKTLMNKLESPDDQASVINCAGAMYHLYADIFRSLPAYGKHGMAAI
jgi:hypothetical protein